MGQRSFLLAGSLVLLAALPLRAAWGQLPPPSIPATETVTLPHPDATTEPVPLPQTAPVPAPIPTPTPEPLPAVPPSAATLQQPPAEEIPAAVEVLATPVPPSVAAVPPPPPSSVIEDRAPVQAKAEFKDMLIPKYQRNKPQWAYQLSGSVNALGSENFFPIETGGVSVQFEFQPRFIQKFGILGLGLNLNAYYLSAGSGFPTPALPIPFGIFSGGGQVRYQLRYLREQAIVPFGGYTAEYAYYNLTSGSGTYWAHGPLVGGMILLNIFEPSAAAEMYADTDISRTYLTTEVRFISGGDGVVNVPMGPSVYVGLRFEL